MMVENLELDENMIEEIKENSKIRDRTTSAK